MIDLPRRPASEHHADLGMLEDILSEANRPELSLYETRVTSEIHAWLAASPRRNLTLKQYAWAKELWDRLRPIDAASVPKGRPVETPAVLRHLPKKPPGRGA